TKCRRSWPQHSERCAMTKDSTTDGDYDGLSSTFAEACRKADEKVRATGSDARKPKLKAAQPDEVRLEDFVAYMPMHNYIFTPTREPWPASSVNARIPALILRDANGAALLDDGGKEVKVSASWWLDRNKPVEQMTWAPGEPMLIRDRLISEG